HTPPAVRCHVEAIIPELHVAGELPRLHVAHEIVRHTVAIHFEVAAFEDRWYRCLPGEVVRDAAVIGFQHEAQPLEWFDDGHRERPEGDVMESRRALARDAQVAL